MSTTRIVTLFGEEITPDPPQPPGRKGRAKKKEQEEGDTDENTVSEPEAAPALVSELQAEMFAVQKVEDGIEKDPSLDKEIIAQQGAEAPKAPAPKPAVADRRKLLASIRQTETKAAPETTAGPIDPAPALEAVAITEPEPVSAPPAETIEVNTPTAVVPEEVAEFIEEVTTPIEIVNEEIETTVQEKVEPATVIAEKIEAPVKEEANILTEEVETPVQEEVDTPTQEVETPVQEEVDPPVEVEETLVQEEITAPVAATETEQPTAATEETVAAPAKTKRKTKDTQENTTAVGDVPSIIPEDWQGDKKYYAIGEVAALFSVKTSHIRFWTNEFKLKVRTTRKGDRLYTPEQVKELRTIYHLVKERGFTLTGAKTKLKTQNKRDVTTIDLKDSLIALRDKLQILRDQL